MTGEGLVFLAAGTRGVYALRQSNGTQAWNVSPGGSLLSTPAYDRTTQALFVVSNNGTLYKLRGTDGAVLSQYATGASSDLPLPPCLYGGRVYVAMGTSVHAVRTADMQADWVYATGGSVVHTPASLSPTTGKVVVCTADLYVHAVRVSDGVRSWRVKPSVHTAGTPYEYARGWPVVAEQHGLVLVRMRTYWEDLWDTPNPFDTTNAATRANLIAKPRHQVFFALRLLDGSVPFVCNTGQGGWGDGGYMPNGGQPVIRIGPDGKEFAYVIVRGDDRYDSRWDSHFGEMMLDDATVSGFGAGEVRWISHDGDAFLLTDESPFITAAGDNLFGAHWIIGYALRIRDADHLNGSLGAYGRKIIAQNLPYIIDSQWGGAGVPFGSGHYSPNGLAEDPGGGRQYPGGFYIHYNVGNVHDPYWSEYGAWTVSNGLILYRSNDGAVVCLENGNP